MIAHRCCKTKTRVRLPFPCYLVVQPKLGKVSNAVKAELEETLRATKATLNADAMEKEIEEGKIDVTLPG